MQDIADKFKPHLFTVLCLLMTSPASAQTTANLSGGSSKTLRIYQDADLSRHLESALAIQRGIEVAFDEIDNQIQGYNVEFKYLDHRGNVVVSKQNYQTFIDDPRALAIYSGIHSPPLIKNRTFINESKALTLVPWAAGGPITRHPAPENWIFRLSVDDTRAGAELIDFALQQKHCKSPRLLLEKSPWGNSNLESMSAHLQRLGFSDLEAQRFGWNVNERNAAVLLNNFLASGSDCVVFVGNAIEGAVFARAMFNMPKSKRLPIISHWGITGGDFHVKVNRQMRQGLDLTFIQSCFAYTDPQAQDEFSQGVFARLMRLYPDDIRDASDLRAAVGFIHAYDLSRLLIQAINQLQLTGDVRLDRNTIREQLENIDKPVRGLVKTYQQPFSVFDAKHNVNAHEALESDDYCMARFGDRNEVLLLPKSHKSRSSVAG